MSRRYHQLPDVPCGEKCLRRFGKPYGLVLQEAVRAEVGGTPESAAGGYAARSALSFSRQIASSGVPLQIW